MLLYIYGCIQLLVMIYRATKNLGMLLQECFFQESQLQACLEMNFSTFTNMVSKVHKRKHIGFTQEPSKLFLQGKQYFYRVVYFDGTHIALYYIFLQNKQCKYLFKVVKYLICIPKQLEQFFIFGNFVGFYRSRKGFNCCCCIAPLATEQTSQGGKNPHPNFSSSLNCLLDMLCENQAINAEGGLISTFQKQ